MADDDIDTPEEDGSKEPVPVFKAGALEDFLRRHGMDENAGEESEKPADGEPSDASGNFDELLSDLLAPEASADDAAPSPQIDTPPEIDTDLMDEEPESAAAGDDAFAELLASEPEDSGNASENDDAPVGDEDWDTVLGDAEADIPVDTGDVGDVEAPMETVAEADTGFTFGAPESVEEPEPHEEVVLENIAAGAEHQDLTGFTFGETSATEAEPAAPEEVPDEANAEAEDEDIDIDALGNLNGEADVAEAEPAGDVPVRRRLPIASAAAMLAGPFIGIGALFRTNPLRFSAAAIAGLFVFSFTAFYLQNHAFRLPNPDAGLTQYTEAEALLAVEQAAALLRQGERTRALAIVDEVLASTAPSAALTDARYLRIEALLAGLPAQPHTSVTDALHGEIDYAVETARDHPRAAEALFWKAELYERQNNIPAARHTYREIMKDFARAANLDDTLIAFAELELRTDRPREAAQALQRLLETLPNSPRASHARLLLADAYAAVGDIDDARTLYVRTVDAAAGSPEGAQAFERLGKLALETGRPDLAISELEQRLRNATTVEGNDRVLLHLARAYRAAGRLEDAERSLQEILQFFPRSALTPEVYVELSEVLRARGELRRGLRTALDAADEFPSVPRVQENLGNAYLESGDPEAAADAYFRAHETGAGTPDLLMRAAALYRERASLAHARRAYEEVIRSFPGSEAALESELKWAEVVHEQGHPTRAIQRLEEMLLAAGTQEGDWPLRILSTAGPIYRELGLQRQAESAYKRLAALSQDEALRARAAIVLLEGATPDEGLQVAAGVDVAKLDATLAYDFLQAYGRIRLRSDGEQGLALLEQAHEMYPAQRRPEAVQRMLEANLALGRTARARALVFGLAEQVNRSESEHEDRALLVRAANTWGDYLFDRGDYGAAASAYGLALPEPAPAPDSEAASGMSEPELWAAHQYAAALVDLGDLDEARLWLDVVAVSKAPWARDAAGQREALALRSRLRQPVPPAG